MLPRLFAALVLMSALATPLARTGVSAADRDAAGDSAGAGAGSAVAAAAGTTVIAAVSDFGYPNSTIWGQTRNLVRNIIDPDYVISTGDNWQVRTTEIPGDERYDFVVGRRFCDYVRAVPGPECPSASQPAVNRFFPAAGNHDHDDGPLSNYLAYFDLPGAGTTSESPTSSELYYDVVLGNVHLFVIDSESVSVEVEGGSPAVPTSVQKAWLQDAMESSDAPWKVVILHEPPYGSSADYGSTPHLQWNYAGWGADLVINGHAAVYERVQRDGVQYITNGLSEGDATGFGTPISGSVTRISDSDLNTAGRIVATESSLTWTLIDSDGGSGYDSFTLTNPTVQTTSPLPAGTVGTAYSRTFAASGGTPPYTWTRTGGSLPPGLSLSSGGVLSGTPTAAGTYSFTVRATDQRDKRSEPKTFTLRVDPVSEPDTGGAFVGITPDRAFDSRDTTCVSGPDGRHVTLAPGTGIPANASAVALNVTVTGATTNGYLTVYPTGAARPDSSNLNYARNQTIPNAVTSKLGTSGRITLYASSGCPHVVVDVVGYFTGGATGAGGFVGITPDRAFDSRDTTCVSGPDGRHVTLAPGTGIPANASAVALNVTVTGATTNGYLTVYPTGAARPDSSNLNYARNQTIPNAVTSKLGTSGRITLYAPSGCPHVVVDVVGYYTAGTPIPGGFVGITPDRAFDSRDTTCVSGPDGRHVTLAPGTGIPANASAVALNVTVTGATTNGYLTVYPTGAARPGSSNLNYAAGQTIPNAVTSKLGTSGRITLYAPSGCPHVVVDVVGYYTANG